MKKIKRLFYFILITLIGVMMSYYAIFIIPKSAQLNVSVGSSRQVNSEQSLKCYDNAKAEAIDHNGELDVLVWNIFKQSNINWHKTLVQYSTNTNLALLQEVSMNDEFKAYTNKSTWYSSHVDAFRAFGVSTGVLTLSTKSPLFACAHVKLEPWIQLPKSGIYSVFRLSDERDLVVINIHSVNFSYGILEYEQQISAILEALIEHKGPVIFAGDLNTWSIERTTAIKKTLHKLGLNEVKFSPDNRKQFINGMALDYIFYRELTLIDASTPVTDASDHNPLLAKFRL